LHEFSQTVIDPPASASVTTLPLVSGGDSDIDGLTAIIRRLVSAQSLPEVMEVVTHAARVMLAADGITFVLRDADRCYYAEEDAVGPLWKGKRFPMSACISGWCMEHGRTVAIPDIYEDERLPHDAYRPTFVKSLAMVPVRQEEPIAALGAYWSGTHHASAAELQLLQTIANAAALSIAYVQLRETQAGAVWQRLLRRLPPVPLRRSGKLNVWAPSAAFLWSRRIRQIATGVALAAVAYSARLVLIGAVGNDVRYATFYVAAVLSVLIAGPLAGFVALLAGGVAANLSSAEPIGQLLIEGRSAGSLLLYACVCSVLILVTHQQVATSQREKELNRKLQLVRGELQHRIRNFITIVQALAVQTDRSSTDPADFNIKFTKRLQALAGAQEILDDPKHSSAGLGKLIERTLAPFDIGERVAIDGCAELRVSEDVAVGIALVLNELATNALKYGALSVSCGKVSIECNATGDRARLVWSEEGGPKVSPPSRHGFGSRLINSALPKGCGATHLDYRATGVCCSIDFVCIRPEAHG
jgi:two-component sensor histidine kinase